MVFAGSSHWCGCFGGIWWKISWKPQSCLWRKTHTQSCSWWSFDTLRLTAQHISTLFVFTVLCQCSLFMFPVTVITRLSPMGHAIWNFQILAIITSWKNVITIWIYFHCQRSKPKGNQTDVFHDNIFMTHTLQSCAPHDKHMEVHMVLNDAHLSRMVSRWRCGQQTETREEVNYKVLDIADRCRK